MDGDGGRIRKFRSNWISISKGFQRARRIGGKVETLVLWNAAAEVATARTTILDGPWKVFEFAAILCCSSRGGCIDEARY